MLQSQTAILERNTTFSGDFATEPFETGWTREARWFFQILSTEGEPQVDLTTQVSPDGLTWVDLDDPRQASGELTTWPVREYGHWLRIRGTMTGGSVKVRIYLALKS
ncbi:hypothetical protein [Ruania alba]|uniref:Uncharacterized protein n=1 Tax=Ruania alba TaxID=648782 RepID=A0A1H5HQK3_9MICO|nr:hypothetical protein [Ruania alba]SEE30175.1 hypothetical protein SAMN04488554_2034 [Ruania alba]